MTFAAILGSVGRHDSHNEFFGKQLRSAVLHVLDSAPEGVRFCQWTHGNSTCLRIRVPRASAMSCPIAGIAIALLRAVPPAKSSTVCSSALFFAVYIDYLRMRHDPFFGPFLLYYLEHVLTGGY